jgi:hypothetical protein
MYSENIYRSHFVVFSTVYNTNTQISYSKYRGVQNNITCCELFARQVRATFASDSRMWRAHPAWIGRICHANVTRKIRVWCASCSPHANVARCARSPQQGPAVSYADRVCSSFHKPTGRQMKCSFFSYPDNSKLQQRSLTTMVVATSHFFVGYIVRKTM